MGRLLRRAWSNLGLVLNAIGQPAEAIDAQNRA
jgi:hypothetical protein